ncbi:MAG: SPASM domain-containing protein [Methanocorpusculum sp.]|nr:SPASM domain-containing protein [Methanocorpusculum sp.]
MSSLSSLTKSEILFRGKNYLSEKHYPIFLSRFIVSVFSCLPEDVIIRGYDLYHSIGLYKISITTNKVVSSYNIDDMPLFTNIEIETVNRCNGSCSFCPVNIHEPQRPYAKMDSNLVYKIIDELSSLEYSGNIALFSNNEPFLDERIVGFYKYAREHLPRAFIHIYTNGSVLSLEKFIEITQYLDRMIIDNYNDGFELNSGIKRLHEYCETHPDLFKKVIFSMRLQNQVLTSRGGQAPNKQNIPTIRAKCVLPFSQIIIRPDGKISLCCNDALGKYTLGDVTTQTLREIWYSKSYYQIRKEMMTNGRKNLMLCTSCDTT